MSAAAEEHPSEGAPEWMVSYADMITIMMAFFVVMYAMAGTKDVKKEEPVMASMRRQFGRFAPSPSGPMVPRTLSMAGLGDGVQKTPPAKKRSLMGGTPAMRIRLRDPSSIGGILYFAEGEVDLSGEHRRQLEHAVAELDGKRQKIEIRGHTTGRPLPAGSPQQDQWDLAYARSKTVSAALQAAGIDRRRIRVSVAAQNEPLHINGSAEVLARNGRVEVFMLNEFTEDLSAENAEQAQEAPVGQDHDTTSSDH